MRSGKPTGEFKSKTTQAQQKMKIGMNNYAAHGNEQNLQRKSNGLSQNLSKEK